MADKNNKDSKKTNNDIGAWDSWGSAAAAFGAGAAAGLWAMGAANAAKRKIEGENGLQQQLAVLEANRQQVIDPTEGMSNPYENLGVATEAARFEAEQIDIALANTLDAVRQTGAGGATALAQEALKGKRGISASIQKQEMDNQKLKAQGTMQFNQLKAQGKEFKFDAQEMARKLGLEERVYRFRCVEAWSMIVPWTGYTLSKLLKQAEPKASAKYVKFYTAMKPFETGT